MKGFKVIDWHAVTFWGVVASIIIGANWLGWAFWGFWGAIGVGTLAVVSLLALFVVCFCAAWSN